MSETKFSRLLDEEEYEIDSANFSPNGYEGVYLSDGEPWPRIDYVLVFETCEENEEASEQSNAETLKLTTQRVFFENQLKRRGLILQRQTRVIQKDTEVLRHFVLIHAPLEVLAERAEIAKLKVPLQVNDTVFSSWLEYLLGSTVVTAINKRNPFKIHDASIKENTDYFMGSFKRDHLSKYVIDQNISENSLFSVIDRQHLLQQILNSTPFSDQPNDVGLSKLLYDGVYLACYPLHEGKHRLESGESPVNTRQQLKRDWARFCRIFKYQPYDTIKEYFGHEIGLYFAWLGFYTGMLVPLAMISLIVFLCGIISTGSYVPVLDMCNEDNRGRWYMCPLCDRRCSYWNLAPDTCIYAKLTHYFDNNGTVALAFIASMWASLFLEFWKRRQAFLAQKWHTSEFEEEEEEFRPEYLASLTEEDLNPYKPDPLTGKIGPNVFKIKKFRRLGLVCNVISFMILLVIAAMVGVVVYRAAVFAVFSSSSDKKIEQGARILTTATAGLLNLIAITILKFVYNKLAVFLTDWENHPTRTAYKDSFTRKMALFQFVNNYTSIFYIAFFKSEIIVGTPGRYKRVLGKYRLDGCSEQGCFFGAGHSDCHYHG